jgi:hypothetical protein
MKSVNINVVEEVVSESDCKIIKISQPINFTSTVYIKCFCNEPFSSTIKKIRSYKRRRTHINCGCVDKKWTNTHIDENISQRQLLRLTDCNKKGFQPSCMSVEWQCEVCDKKWKARVDSVINKHSGCPHCAGNRPYTILSLQAKLTSNDRRDLIVRAMHSGSFRSGLRQQAHATFQCVVCDNQWKANIHNVIKFSYGCPACNNNISTRIEVHGEKFDSKLEYYFWKRYKEENISFIVLRQQKYLPTRRLMCDYYIPEKHMWIEITGGFLLKQNKYCTTIDEKKSIVERKGERFITLTTSSDINKLIKKLKESNK